MQEPPREQHWQNFLFIISLLVFSTGVYFYFKNRHTRGMHHATHHLINPDQERTPAHEKPEGEHLATEGSGGVEEKQLEKPEMASMDPEVSGVHEKHPSESHGKEKHHAIAETLAEVPSHLEATSQHHKARTKSEHDGTSAHEASEAHVKGLPVHLPGQIAKRLAKQDEGTCQTIDEWMGPGEPNVSKKDWEVVVKQFRKSKALLNAWLDKLDATGTEQMKQQLKTMKIYGAPWKKEEALHWETLGLWIREENGSSALYMSPHFVSVALEQPVRAQFEMTRLVAQAWAPCELERLKLHPIWDPFLTCIQQKKEICSTSPYSEAGWAASSGIAQMLTPPQCALPVFESKEMQECLKMVSSHGLGDQL